MLLKIIAMMGIVFNVFFMILSKVVTLEQENQRYRLAENSVKIIDHCVAQGVPFAREYAGLLDNRSFGGAQVSRTFYAGKQVNNFLLGAYQAMMKEVERKRVMLHTREEFMVSIG